MTSTQQQEVERLVSSVLASSKSKAKAMPTDWQPLADSMPQEATGAQPNEFMRESYSFYDRLSAETRKDYQIELRRFGSIRRLLFLLSVVMTAFTPAIFVAIWWRTPAYALLALMMVLLTGAWCVSLVKAYEQARYQVSELRNSLKNAQALLELCHIFDRQSEDWLCKRRATLIDKKFQGTLSTDENEELQHIEARIEEYDALFYAPVIKKLEALYEQSTQQPA